jgi:hypothetical protein
VRFTLFTFQAKKKISNEYLGKNYFNSPCQEVGGVVCVCVGGGGGVAVREALDGHRRCENDIVAAWVEHVIVRADRVRDEEKGAKEGPTEAQKQKPALEGYGFMLAIDHYANELNLRERRGRV